MSQHMQISVLIKMPKKYKLRRACADTAIAASIHKDIKEKHRVEGDKEDGFVQNISNGAQLESCACAFAEQGPTYMRCHNHHYLMDTHTYCMVCGFVREDNSRALASGLFSFIDTKTYSIHVPSLHVPTLARTVSVMCKG